MLYCFVVFEHFFPDFSDSLLAECSVDIEEYVSTTCIAKQTKRTPFLPIGCNYTLNMPLSFHLQDSVSVSPTRTAASVMSANPASGTSPTASDVNVMGTQTPVIPTLVFVMSAEITLLVPIVLCEC